MQVDVFKMSRVELWPIYSFYLTCSLTVYLKGLNWDFIYIYCTIHRQRTCLQSNNQLSCNFLLFILFFYPPIISCHPIGQWKDLLFYYFSCVLFRCRLKSFFFFFLRGDKIQSSSAASLPSLPTSPECGLQAASPLILLLFCVDTPLSSFSLCVLLLASVWDIKVITSLFDFFIYSPLSLSRLFVDFNGSQSFHFFFCFLVVALVVVQVFVTFSHF